MSAPDSSNSKAPPSLLSDKAKGADGNSSRILANLEGRVAPPAEKPRRSRLPLVLVALLVICAGGWGAWHMQQRVQNGAAEVAGAPAGAVVDKTAAAAAPVSGASGAAVSTAKADAPAAASSQAATIIADDSDKDKPAAPGNVSAESAASAGGDNNRLSRALADGAEPSNGSAPLAAAAGASATAVPAGKNEKGIKSASAAAGHAKHDTASAKGKHETASANHRAGTPTAVALAKKPHAAANGGNASKDDSDADLLAALVARTKPADVKPAAGGTSAKGSASANAASAKLAERVKECSQREFFEDQLCRWRVCDGHWGKDPSCPGSAQQARQP